MIPSRRGAGAPVRAARVLAGVLSCAAVAPHADAAAETPAAGPSDPPACGARAARYDDGSGFGLAVTRAGQTRVENPLRPLTPEVTRVLQVVIGGKVATAYGSDLGALRRGASPGAVEAVLGGPVRWEAALPALPEAIAIIGEDGATLSRLTFRTCEPPPAVRAPQARQPAARPAKPRGTADRAPGFSMPQGAIAE